MADIPIQGKLRAATVAGIIADAEQIDVNGTKLPTVLDSKEDSMFTSGTWPGEPEENKFQKNSIYNININSEETDRTVGFDDGDSSDDMLYISLNSNNIQSDNISIVFQGNNYLGLNSPFSIFPHHLYEIIGIWNPSLHKWIFNTRSLQKVIEE